MSKNAMAGAITLCGIGLCMIGGALMMQSGNSAHAGSMPAAVVAATHAQAAPTIVWYQALTVNVYEPQSAYRDEAVLLRAWSDGTIEGMVFNVSLVDTWTCENWPDQIPFSPSIGSTCNAGWHVISSPTQGYKAAADVNADELVNGIDLASVLDSWGDAPRVPFPPSDCPLNLINP